MHVCYRPLFFSPYSLFSRAQINDVEKGYYADGEDAYDMRLPFAQKESSSGIKPMTPFKQVVAVNPSITKLKDEAPKPPAAQAEGEGDAGEASVGSAAEAEGGDGPSAEAVMKKLEGLSVEAGKA